MSLISLSVGRFLHRNGVFCLGYRGYAKEVLIDKIRLTFSLPHSVLYNCQKVVQVDIPATSGNMGILAQHVPTVEQLQPGIVDVIEENGISKKFFVAGGFATVQSGSSWRQSVSENLQEAQKVASGNGTEKEIAEAKIQIEVLESLRACLK
ncbi:hypothetical protein PCK2_000360 [Pneumocystis canis]|nr:hypothetical protein PCK2_000360 [Pneumocystis canis]